MRDSLWFSCFGNQNRFSW